MPILLAALAVPALAGPALAPTFDGLAPGQPLPSVAPWSPTCDRDPLGDGEILTWTHGCATSGLPAGAAFLVYRGKDGAVAGIAWVGKGLDDRARLGLAVGAPVTSADALGKGVATASLQGPDGAPGLEAVHRGDVWTLEAAGKVIGFALGECPPTAPIRAGRPSPRSPGRRSPRGRPRTADRRRVAQDAARRSRR